MSTHNLCYEQKYEKISEFLSENFQFLVVKFSIYLNRHVFVMWKGVETVQTTSYVSSHQCQEVFFRFWANEQVVFKEKYIILHVMLLYFLNAFWLSGEILYGQTNVLSGGIAVQKCILFDNQNYLPWKTKALWFWQAWVLAVVSW